MNKVVELLGTPKKDDCPEGYKLASKCSNYFINIMNFIDYNFP